MPISAQQWRLRVGRVNASRSLRPRVTGQPKMKLTSLDVFLFILTALLGAILSGDGGRGTGERKCVSRGSGGGGTVGELVPSLLTAPWRKELLILAGDVETNPGPYTYYGRLRESDLELVMEELRGVEEKWESIGRDVFRSALKAYPTYIHTSHSTSHDCMREVLRRRLQDPIFTTWRIIIVALRKAGEAQLADNLKAKYIPDLLEVSDLDLLTQELTGVKQKWYEIGVDLGNKDKVNDIRRQYSDPDVCLRESLKVELQQSAPTTWRNIVDALRSRDVSESQLSDLLEAKYCPNLLSVSLAAKELTAVCEKWQYIGEELGVGQYLLWDIRTKHSDPGDCLREVLRKQLRNCATTWGDIIAVLRSPRIGDFQLADNLEAKYYLTSQRILEEALKKGYVDCHIWKVLVTGAAGSGKTSLKYRLFGKELPSVRCSTALAEAAIRAISREIVGTDLTGWFRVTPDELMGMLSGALKKGVPMEEKMLPSGTPETGFHKWPTRLSKTDDSKVSAVGNITARSPPKLTPRTTEAAAHRELSTTDDSKQSERDLNFVGSSPLFSDKYSVTSPHETATYFSAQVKGELVQLVEKAEGSKHFLELQWIHFIDSGGQPQFHEILPAFIRNTTATIFVMKLSERLDEHPKIKYFDKNGQLCGKPFRHALSNDQMLQCCVRTIHSRPSSEGIYSKTLIVGTHRDREHSCSESRAKKNRKLINMLSPSLQKQLVYYHLGSEVIFPINAKKPKEQDNQVCAEIRKQIEDKECGPPPYKIPVGWFLLEQGIIKASKGSVISKTECFGIAAALGINAGALIAALEYFDDLNIFLYFPSVLPEVVFSDPQVPLNKVTELVHFSYCLHSKRRKTATFFGKVSKLFHFHSSRQSDSPPVALEGKWLQFRDKGIVTLEMFQDDRFSAHYIPDLFTPADLIKLLKHLLIIAPLSDTEYFMPSLLQMITPEEVIEQLPPTSSSVVPLLVHFPGGCAQNGVFCALVVHLISKYQWQFALNSDGTPVCISRSCIRFRLPDKPVYITLVDSFTFFELHVEEASGTLYNKFCPLIRQALFSGLKAAAKSLRYNNSTPVPAFRCKCSSPPHAATPDDEKCYLICTRSTNIGLLTKQHRMWLDVKEHMKGDCGGNVTQLAKMQDLEHTLVEVTPYHLPTQQHTQVSGYGHEFGSQPVYTLCSQQPEVTQQGHEMISRQPEQYQYSYPELQHPSSQDHAARPTLIECIRFRGRERRINIPQEIGVQYRHFGLFLLEDHNGARIRALAHKHNNDSNEINIEIIEEWVAGKGKQPVTWKTLTQVLRDIELCTLAEEIEAIKG